MRPLGPLVASGQYFVAPNRLTVIQQSAKSVVCYTMQCNHVLVSHTEMAPIYAVTLRYWPMVLNTPATPARLVDQNSDKAVVLNIYFHSFFSTLQLPLDELSDCLDPSCCPSNLLCTEDKVFDLIASPDISKSMGPD